MRTPRMRGLLSRDRTTGQIAVGLVGVLLVSALVYGVGMASAQYKISDVGAWLTASAKGMLVHANGLSGKVDGKTDLPFPKNHRIRIVQDGRNVLLIDDTTGVVSRIDPSQLKVEQGRKLGVGLEIVTGAGAAYTVDRYKGTVQQIDPMSLAAVGQPTTLKAPLGRPALDQKGTLWVPSAGEGRLSAFQGGRQTRTVEVAGPTSVLSLSIVAGTPVAVDSAHAVAAVVRPEGAQKVKLPGTVTQTVPNGGVRLPSQADSLTVPLLGRAAELTLLDTSTGGYTSVALKATRDALGEPQILGSKVYIPNETKGGLLVYNAATRTLEPFVPVSGRPGPLDVFVKDGLLWANDPDGDKALSVDSNGVRKPIRKYEDKVPGSNRKPLPDDKGDRNGSPGGNNGGNGGNTPTRPPRQRPNDPPAAPPLTATGENGTITVAFNEPAHGRIAPKKYLLKSNLGDKLPSEAQAGSPFSQTIEGLECGKVFKFRAATVYADPRTRRDRTRWSPEVTATACTKPGAPEGLSADSGNGFINVSFNEGQQTDGVKDYVLTDDSGKPVAGVAPIRPGASARTFKVTRGMDCDQEYTYRVAARPKETAAGLATSEGRVTKRPCVAPGAPTSVLTADATDHTATLKWSAVTGRQITYRVAQVGGETRDVPSGLSTAFTGLTNHKKYDFTVQAKNGAGVGPTSKVTADLAYVTHVYKNKANNQTNTLVRPNPSKTGQVGTIPKGEYRDLTVICQVKNGDSVTEEETGETSTVWNQISWNGGIGYLSVTLMEGPRSPGGKMFEC